MHYHTVCEPVTVYLSFPCIVFKTNAFQLMKLADELVFNTLMWNRCEATDGYAT